MYQAQRTGASSTSTEHAPPETSPGKQTRTELSGASFADAGHAHAPSSTGAVQAPAVQQRVVQQQVVQRKIGSGSNVIFGLSGRDLESIKAALQAGYQTFDGADSYAGTIAALAAAMQELGTPRGDVEVIYKIDVTPPEGLASHLQAVADSLGGYLDHVLIHKATDTAQAARYEPILAALKDEGLIRKVGAGDVTANMAEHLQGKDSFEIDASDLFLGVDAAALVQRLNDSTKPVFVYNTVATLKKLVGLDPRTRPSQSQISAMVNAIVGKVPKAEVIMSSSSAETIIDNLEIDTPTDYTVAGDTFAAIELGARPDRDALPIAEMPEHVRARLTFAFATQWDLEVYPSEAAYAGARDARLGDFSPQELDVHYELDGKLHSLRELLHMLFDSTGNCHRVEAYNFLIGMFG